MGFPAGMQLATIAFGIPLTATGKEVVTNVTVKPTARLIWAATGQPLPEFEDSFTAEAGQLGQFQVPFVDQPGFIDSLGNAVTDFAYQVTASWQFGNARPITWSKNLKPMLGQTGPIDLDLVPDGPVSIPVTAPTAAVLGFNGRTGFITLQDSDLPARLSDAQLTATYASPRFARPKPTRSQPQLSVMTTFQTGHGYTANSGTWTADTGVYALGSQSIKTTATTTSATLRKLAQPAQDLSGRDFAALIKVDDPTLLSALHLYLGKNSLASYEPLQLSLGGISANSTILPNTWTWVYFSWADAGNPVGTPDRTAITDWQLRALGNSTTPVTVWFNAIAHYPRRQVFPKGCVSFACDDGRLSQYTRMAPALDKYGYGATAYVIVEALGTAAKMTYDQVKELEKFHRWEIAGHAYTSNAHNNGMTTLSLPDLDVEMRKLRDWLQQGNHKGADLFAYPLGFDNPDVVETVSRYFVNARQIVRAPFQNADLDQPYRMRSNSISSSDPLSVAKVWIDKAAANGTWLTITMHDIVDGTPAAGTEWPTADFQALVDYVAASGVEVMPVGAALDRANANQPVPVAAPINGGTP